VSVVELHILVVTDLKNNFLVSVPEILVKDEQVIKTWLLAWLDEDVQCSVIVT
jgi:hypothetical protein